MYSAPLYCIGIQIYIITDLDLKNKKSLTRSIYRQTFRSFIVNNLTLFVTFLDIQYIYSIYIYKQQMCTSEVIMHDSSKTY